jgi:hypothetical protein
MDLQEHVRAELVRYLVSRAITCPITGDVLDVRTCAVVLDADGDPAAVFSPKGGQLVADTAGALRPGYTLATCDAEVDGQLCLRHRGHVGPHNGPEALRDDVCTCPDGAVTCLPGCPSLDVP